MLHVGTTPKTHRSIADGERRKKRKGSTIFLEKGPSFESKKQRWMCVCVCGGGGGGGEGGGDVASERRGRARVWDFQMGEFIPP